MSFYFFVGNVIGREISQRLWSVDVILKWTGVP